MSENNHMKPTPSKRHASWHETNPYAIVHFGLSTFAGREWGYGNESPELFNPTAFDAEQWARVCKDSGMKGIVMVAKHCDGFCLWPTKTTEHCLRNSKWREGKGDVVGDVSAACRKYGLKFGVYCSPWDRNHPEYGRASYVDIYHAQLKELLTWYGPVFELWLDGANGGDGYYGGANERRPIDIFTYYRLDELKRLVGELQPEAVIFSEDLRYIGNENGVADDPCWQTFSGNSMMPVGGGGTLGSGDRNGSKWMPGECDVPLRRGWFFHEEEVPKNPNKLLDIYLKSIGRGCALDIGLAPDRRGLICDDDIAALKGWNELVKRMFKVDLLRSAPLKVKPEHFNCKGECMTPGGEEKEPALVFEFAKPEKFNLLDLAEFVELGQRVESFALDTWTEGAWSELASASSIGYRRLLLFKTVEAARLRIRFTKSSATPAIANVSLYKMPSDIIPCDIRIVRGSGGLVEIRNGNGLELHYTTNGSTPATNSPLYTKPFPLNEGTVKVIGVIEGKTILNESTTFGCDRSKWRIVSVSLDSAFKNDGEAGVEMLLDDNPETYWHTYHNDKKTSAPPHEVVMEMERERSVGAFTFMPCHGTRFGRDSDGTPDKYEFHLSMDGKTWQLAAEGEFTNIKANPVMQFVKLDRPFNARYLRFVAKHVVDDGSYVKVAGIGAVEDNSI